MTTVKGYLNQKSEPKEFAKFTDSTDRINLLRTQSNVCVQEDIQPVLNRFAACALTSGRILTTNSSCIPHLKVVDLAKLAQLKTVKVTVRVVYVSDTVERSFLFDAYAAMEGIFCLPHDFRIIQRNNFRLDEVFDDEDDSFLKNCILKKTETTIVLANQTSMENIYERFIKSNAVYDPDTDVGLAITMGILSQFHKDLANEIRYLISPANASSVKVIDATAEHPMKEVILSNEVVKSETDIKALATVILIHTGKPNESTDDFVAKRFTSIASMLGNPAYSFQNLYSHMTTVGVRLSLYDHFKTCIVRKLIQISMNEPEHKLIAYAVDLLRDSQLTSYNLSLSFIRTPIKTAAHLYPQLVIEMARVLQIEALLIEKYGLALVPFIKLIDPKSSETSASSFKNLACTATVFETGKNATMELFQGNLTCEISHLIPSLLSRQISSKYYTTPGFDLTNDRNIYDVLNLNFDMIQADRQKIESEDDPDLKMKYNDIIRKSGTSQKKQTR